MPRASVRRLAAAGALVVAGVLAVLIAPGGGFLRDRAVRPSPSPSSPSASSSPSPASAGVRPVPGKPVTYHFPDSIGLTAKDLPFRPVMRTAPYTPLNRYVSTVYGQYCQRGRMPGLVANHYWGWLSDDPPKPERGVFIDVTVWEDAASAFRDLVNNTGHCRWVGNYPQQRPAPGVPGDDVWAGELSRQEAVTAVRIGNVILGLEFLNREGDGRALPTAVELTALSAQRLKTYLDSLQASTSR